jgi:hypothetical protein
MNYWVAISPLGVGAAWFLFHVFRQPYKIYKEQHDEYKQIIEQRDEKIASLLERFKPKFKLSCDKTTDGRVTISGNTQVYFFRMKVETDCMSGIDGCLGHLYKIEKDGVTVFSHDSLELPFSRAEEPDSLAKRIVPDDPKWVGILAVHLHQRPEMSEVEILIRAHNPHALPKIDDWDYVVIATKQHSLALDIEGKYIFSKAGDYILHVNIVGKDAPTAKARLKFTWTGYARDSTLEMIE